MFKIIQLDRVLPHIFEEKRGEIQSDVWLQQMQFDKGKHYLIEAASGTGKSSLCSYIFGYRNDYLGSITFDNPDIDGLRHQDLRQLTVRQWVEIRRLSLSLLWQDLRLFPELTALENVLVKNNLTHGFQPVHQIDEWFERLGIADKKQSLVGRMSFGQQQRVALIRSLCQPFDFLFADEPISHLDDVNAQVAGAILLEEATRQGSSIIVTSIGKHLDLPYDKIIKL